MVLKLPSVAIRKKDHPMSDEAAVSIDTSRVVLLAARSYEARRFAADLKPNQLVGIIWEQAHWNSTFSIWRRRARRHGATDTASRFVALTLDHLEFRFREARLRAGLPTVGEPNATTFDSINAPGVIPLLQEWQPTLVVVCGTSLIRREVLSALSSATTVNVHVGRTPAYRGTHGGAWALIEDQPQDVVTTVHLLDEGIDTGKPIAYVPSMICLTMTGIARAQVSAGLAWLTDLCVGADTARVTPPTPVSSQPVRYPPTCKQWLAFRRSVRRIKPVLTRSKTHGGGPFKLNVWTG